MCNVQEAPTDLICTLLPPGEIIKYMLILTHCIGLDNYMM